MAVLQDLVMNLRRLVIHRFCFRFGLGLECVQDRVRLDNWIGINGARSVNGPVGSVADTAITALMAAPAA